MTTEARRELPDDLLDRYERAVSTTVAHKQALGLLDKDGHVYSTRPCATCSTISSLVGREFGCVARAAFKVR